MDETRIGHDKKYKLEGKIKYWVLWFVCREMRNKVRVQGQMKTDPWILNTESREPKWAGSLEGVGNISYKLWWGNFGLSDGCVMMMHFWEVWNYIPKTCKLMLISLKREETKSRLIYLEKILSLQPLNLRKVGKHQEIAREPD